MRAYARLLAATVLIGSAVCSPSASAATLLFNFASSTDQRNNFSFAIDETQAVPITSDAFSVRGVSVTSGSAVYQSSVEFFLGSAGGGLALDPNFNLTGPQLFTGSLSAPNFLTGSFALSGFDDQSAGGTLTISSLSSAVPEPATWSMMLIGVGVIGASLRLRRRVTAKPAKVH